MVFVGRFTDLLVNHIAHIYRLSRDDSIKEGEPFYRHLCSVCGWEEFGYDEIQPHFNPFLQLP